MALIQRKMEIVKNIVLIAHDNRKEDLLEWVHFNKGTLSKHHLSATGTTGKLIQEKTQLPVYRFISGPLGGDQQIGAKIVEDGIDFMVFFWDPLTAQPHDPDVKALLRIAVLYFVLSLAFSRGLHTAEVAPVSLNRLSNSFKN